MIRRKNIALAIIMVIMAVVVLFPFYLVVVNSFKTLPEISENIMRLPEIWHGENFTRAMEKMNFWHTMMNTLMITFIASFLHILFATMAGYWLIRHPGRLNNFFYFLLIAAMAVPFQSIMIPVISITKLFHLHGSLWGISCVYLGMGCSTVVFLTYGAVKSIPLEIEEAAVMDGCTPLTMYFLVIFPLLRTIVLTYSILNVFWFWNDYLTPQLMLGTKKSLYTMQIALKVFSGEYLVRWDYLLPAVVLAMILPVIVFIICQRSIIDGMVSGAVKG